MQSTTSGSLGKGLLSSLQSSEVSVQNSFSAGPSMRDEELTSGVEHELERDIVVMRFYARPWWRMALFWLSGIASATLVWLVCLWSVDFRRWLMYSDATVHDAQYVYVELRDKRSGISQVHVMSAAHQGKTVRYFVFHTVRFIYSPLRRTFEAVPGIEPGLSAELVGARRSVGVGDTPCCPAPAVRRRRELQYGENLLHVETPSFWMVFAHDALQPFCCFQYLSVIIWSLEAYYTYSVVVFVITMASVLTNSISQYQERKRMAELAHYACDVELVTSGGGGGTLREGAPAGMGPHGYPLVQSSMLVPGDVVVVAPGKMAYDGILLEGETVMDETVLTGESIPIRKAAYDIELDGATYNPDTFNHCTLFNGTIVSAVRGGRSKRPALALVASTGFNTAKGRLLRTIMFPRGHGLNFVKQAMYFIVLMFIMATCFYIWDVVAMVRLGVEPVTIGLKAFDMITTAVPPALACCLAIATTISVMRLKKHDVYVLDAERVALGGLLDAICFDKTGTLTESGLELGGVLLVENGGFLSQPPDPRIMAPSITQLFSSCHGLTQLGDTVVGDPLDQRLFEASGFEMRFQDTPPPALTAVGSGAAGVHAAGPFLVVRRQALPPVPELPGAAASRGALLSQSEPRSHGEQMLAGGEAEGSSPGPVAMLQALSKSLSRRVSREYHSSPGNEIPDDLTPRASQDLPAAQHGITLSDHVFDPKETVYVLRRFDFSSERLRSTAVIQQPDGKLLVLTKGSPEKLLTFVDPMSVPPDFHTTLQRYTNQGLRVIAMAWREVQGLEHPSQVLAMSQDALEQGTQLLGLVLMVNKLKPESAPAIQHLHKACIRTAMVTGDHVRTAVTVARQCAIMNGQAPAMVVDVAGGTLSHADFLFEIMAGEDGRLPTSVQDTNGSSYEPSLPPVPESLAHEDTADGHGLAATPFKGSHGPTLDLASAMRAAAQGEVQVAVTGRAWQKANLEPETHADLLDIMLQRGTVFARMNPEDKAQLIAQLGFGDVDASGRVRPGCGYYTGYCGDGANDLGALKGALVGVSLCDAEASIAAPMTSRTPHIGVMITVVAEGRCSLVTSLIIFKYTMVYAYIQVLSLALLYNLGLTVGNYQYFIQDLFHTTLLASCMGLTAPASSLSRERPLGRVLSAGVILPVAAQMAVDTVIQLAALGLLYRQDWFTPYDGSDPISIPVSEKRPENSVMMIICSWQLIINALVFNVGRPFRKGLWTNPWLLCSLLGLIAFNLYVLWAPSDPFKARVPAVVEMPVRFRSILFLLVLVNLCTAYLVDYLTMEAYRAGKMWLDRRRMSTKRERRLQGGPLRLPPVNTPPMEMSHSMTGAEQGLLPAQTERSAAAPAPVTALSSPA